MCDGHCQRLHPEPYSRRLESSVEHDIGNEISFMYHLATDEVVSGAS